MTARKFALIGIVAGLIVSQAALAENRRLMGDEIRSLLPGATMSGMTSKGDRWQARFGADGSYTLELPAKNWSDSGSWDVEDDKYCSERSKRGRRCAILYAVEGDEYLMELSNREESKITITK